MISNFVKSSQSKDLFKNFNSVILYENKHSLSGVDKVIGPQKHTNA